MVPAPTIVLHDTYSLRTIFEEHIKLKTCITLLKFALLQYKICLYKRLSQMHMLITNISYKKLSTIVIKKKRAHVHLKEQYVPMNYTTNKTYKYFETKTEWYLKWTLMQSTCTTMDLKDGSRETSRASSPKTW